jgi:urease accessory protein
VSGSGELQLHYRREGSRTVAQDRHHGPLRVLKPLYPEGEGICHHVLVHPPGGLVGGDRLQVQVDLAPGAQVLITTPGATRFYRSEGPAAVQQVTLHLAADARLEWLPLEAIAYPGCHGQNRLQMNLADGAEMLGWDVLALGLPVSGKPYSHGRYQQHLAWPGVWLERGCIAGEDAALLQGPAGLAGRRVLGTLWWASGTALAGPRRDALLEAARALLPAAAGGDGADAVLAGATSPDPRLVLLRVLAQRVEPAHALLLQVRAAWRALAWDLPAAPPRIWRT